MCQSDDRTLDYCEVATKKWQLDRLCNDLAAVKKLSKPYSRGLSDLEKRCLCLLLNDLRPSEIAQQLNRKYSALRVELSKGLYQYVRFLTDREVENWRDVTRFLCPKYRRCSRTLITISIDTDRLAAAEKILQQLQEVAGSSLEIHQIEVGSLMLPLDGSPKRCRSI